MDQQLRRTIFNLVGCNLDDHVKNFAFPMDRQGRWQLSPAYDLCDAEGSDFTRSHQLILDEVLEAFSGWEARAESLGVPQRLREHVTRTLRLRW